MVAKHFTLLVLAVAVCCAVCAAPVMAVSPGPGAPGIVWQQLLGGSDDERAGAIAQTADGGYFLIGDSLSSKSGDVKDTNHAPDWYDSLDLWVVRLNATGGIMWQRLLGGEDHEWARMDQNPSASLRSMTDGGCIFLATSDSSVTGDVTGTSNGLEHLWVVRLASNGTILWDRLLGENWAATGNALQLTPDGGCIVLGQWMETYETGFDLGLVKLNATGGTEWLRVLGGENIEWGGNVAPTAD